MFERFTKPARQVVVLTQEEARILKHNYIGTEHILLGLLREEKGLAARVLASLGITVERVRAQVVRIVGLGEEVISGQIPFTPRAKKVLELALSEALSLGHNYIGTEHILLGLVRENEGVAARILLHFYADSEEIRGELIRMLTGAGGGTRGGIPQDLRTARLPESLFDWAGEPLTLLAREIEGKLGRPADASDLLIVLASLNEGTAARTLAQLGVDANKLTRAAEQVRAAAAPSELAPDPALLAVCEKVRAEKETAIEAQEFDRAADLHDRERQLRSEARQVAEEHLHQQLVTAARTRLGLSQT